MRADLLDILACPKCRDGEFDLESREEVAGEVRAGTLTCRACGARFPITDHIPRFVQPEDDYCRNFGFQWQKWKTVQVDRIGGHGISTRRLSEDSKWSPEWLAGKRVLDAGCGSGRFTDALAGHGARVVAIDLSAAVDACYEVTRVHGDRVDCLQASLFELPFKPGVFDAVMCFGVIQHTPDPARVMCGLPRFAKPGGRLAYNFYERGQLEWLQVIKYGLRLITPHLPVGVTLALSRVLVALLFPLTFVLAKVPVLRQAIRLIPIASVHTPELSAGQQYTWTLLDTFDWYGARYEYRQDHRQVIAMLEDQGLAEVEGTAGIVRARVPEPADAARVAMASD